MIPFLVGTAWAGDPDLQHQVEALQEQVDAQSREIAALRDGRELQVDPADPNKRVGFGEPVKVDVDENVDEVVSFGRDVDVLGHVQGDAVSFGGDVRVGGTGDVGGDAVSFGGRVQVANGGRVAGNKVAMDVPVGLPSVRISPEGASHDGAPEVAGNLRLSADTHAMLLSLYHRVVWMLSVAGASVLVVGIFPHRVSRVAQDLEARPVRSAVVGTLATGFLVAFAVLFAVVTLGLGSPLSLALLALLSVAWLLGFVGLAQAVGDRLPVKERPHGRWIALLVGVLLITFLSSLPWVGWMVVAGASLLGIGSSLSTRFGGQAA